MLGMGEIDGNRGLAGTEGFGSAAGAQALGTY